jgi:hypothetical protein
MDRISDTERQRIAELLAEGAPVWRLHKEINRSRYAIRRAVVALHRPPKREPRRRGLGAVTVQVWQTVPFSRAKAIQPGLWRRPSLSSVPICISKISKGPRRSALAAAWQLASG